MNEKTGASDSEQVLCELDAEGIATLSINNPARRNAVNPDMRNALREHLSRLMIDSKCRAIIITGTQGHFSAGADVSKFGVKNLLDARARQAHAIKTIPLIAEGPKPVVAAIEGYCLGMSMGIAMACDYIVAASDAKLCVAAPKIGVSAEEHGLAFTVPRRLGWTGVARRILQVAPMLTGDECGAIGLVDEVTAPGEALGAARRVAIEFGNAPPAAFALTKIAMSEGLQDALRRELDHQAALLLTQDHEEGKRAFADKRKPTFTGD